MKYRLIQNQDFLNSYDERQRHFDIGTLKNLIEQNFGESNDIDFKEKFIEPNKLAKLILAMTNSGGGTVIFGVDDNNKPVGLLEEEIKDPTDLQRELSKFLPSQLEYFDQSIKYPEDDIYGDFSNKVFIIYYVPTQYRYVPFISLKQSTDLKTNIIYIRKNSSVEAANNEDIEKMIEKRVYSVYEELSSLDLEEHIEHLKILYQNTPKYITGESPLSNILLQATNPLTNSTEKNTYYPKESFEEFMSKTISKKKKKIETLLEVLDIKNLD